MATRATATITMSMREADRLKVVQAVVDRMLRVGQAAKRIGVTPRQLERLLMWRVNLDERRATIWMRTVSRRLDDARPLIVAGVIYPGRRPFLEGVRPMQAHLALYRTLVLQ